MSETSKPKDLATRLKEGDVVGGSELETLTLGEALAASKESGMPVIIYVLGKAAGILHPISLQELAQRRFDTDPDAYEKLLATLEHARLHPETVVSGDEFLERAQGWREIGVGDIEVSTGFPADDDL